ncbi:MAG: hypothetical protein LIO40_00055 [Ruminococcus sp.]|nr:hypothetical protein [Ruminococcus sp.]
MPNPNLRPDHNGTQRRQFESNKKKIYASQSICGICGKPVDFGRRASAGNSRLRLLRALNLSRTNVRYRSREFY